MNDADPSTSPDGQLKSRTEPLRLVLEIQTSDVRGERYGDKIRYIQNLLCQHHFGRDYDKSQEYTHVYGDEFAMPDHACYIAIDHGDNDVATVTDVPSIWYKFTGEEM